jgi:CO/xanthine dehydrogenase Mo-binding subunit
LTDGLATATGQVLESTGIRECLLALKADYDAAEIKGLATGIKNCGVGNAMTDEARIKIEIRSQNHIIIHHGWTEMGQGVHNIAVQTLCNETGLDPDIMEVEVDSASGIETGMTTSSRATMLAGNAVIAASKKLREDLANHDLKDLVGKTYRGSWICDWTTKPGEEEKEPVTHFAYGYAAQLCILNREGKIDKVVAAHDAGKIMNPTLFEGQIEGAVHMGTGYAISEDLPMENGQLKSDKLKDCGVLRCNETPDIEVIGIEVKDKYGPYGAKGIGEIGMVPTAGAIACAYFNYDGKKRFSLPLKL